MPPYLLPCLLLAVLLAAPSARADQFEVFHLDPSRSHMQFLFGDFGAQLTTQDFLFAQPTLQPGSAPAPLAGHFVLQIGNDASSPTFFGILPGTADVRPADPNTVSPGPGGIAGTTDAAFGLSFDDPAQGISGDVAIHDLVFGLQGFYSVFANPLGPLGLQGDLGWILAAATLEIQTSVGIGGTAFIPSTGAAGFVDRNASQFSEVSPGVYEVVLPYEYTLNFSTDSGPFTNTTATLTFGGEIVASNVVPEPGTAGLLGLGLGLVSAKRRVARRMGGAR